MELSVTGRTYLVTGGGSGIGKAVAETLAAAGGNVLIVGRTEARLALAANDIARRSARGGDTVRTATVDVTDEDRVAELVGIATEWRGRLDGVVHCAGGSEPLGPLTHTDSQAWRNTVDLNVNGTMYLLKHGARGPDYSSMVGPMFGEDALRGVVEAGV